MGGSPERDLEPPGTLAARLGEAARTLTAHPGMQVWCPSPLTRLSEAPWPLAGPQPWAKGGKTRTRRSRRWFWRAALSG
jgi:hypothetical protein